MTRLLALLLALLPGLASAGAWPRGEGQVFVSVGQDVGRDADGEVDGSRSLLLEYGLTDRLTLGAKVWMPFDGRFVDGYAFARYPIGSTEGRHRFAIGLGLGGRRHFSGEIQPMVRPELSWGMGFETRFGPGWVSVEAAAGQLFGGDDDPWVQADATFGLSPTDTSHIIMQLRGYRQASYSALTIAPSYVRQIRKGLKIEIGATYRLEGENRAGLLLGSWLEF